MWAHTDIKNFHTNLSNGDKQIKYEHKLIIYSCSNAWWELWMSFDWWHPEFVVTITIRSPFLFVQLAVLTHVLQPNKIWSWWIKGQEPN